MGVFWKELEGESWKIIKIHYILKEQPRQGYFKTTSLWYFVTETTKTNTAAKFYIHG